MGVYESFNVWFYIWLRIVFDFLEGSCLKTHMSAHSMIWQHFIRDPKIRSFILNLYTLVSLRTGYPTYSKFQGHLDWKNCLVTDLWHIKLINQMPDARYELELIIDFFLFVQCAIRSRTTFEVKPKFKLNEISYNWGKSITLDIKYTKYFEK